MSVLPGISSTVSGVREPDATAWRIWVSGYGEFDFHGTEAEAEEMRSHKANWERGQGRKWRADLSRESDRLTAEIVGLWSSNHGVPQSLLGQLKKAREAEAAEAADHSTVAQFVGPAGAPPMPSPQAPALSELEPDGRPEEARRGHDRQGGGSQGLGGRNAPLPSRTERSERHVRAGFGAESLTAGGASVSVTEALNPSAADTSERSDPPRDDGK